MGIEIGDDISSEGVSNCCYSSVSNPSGEGIEGRCTDCQEMCEIVSEDEDSDSL